MEIQQEPQQKCPLLGAYKSWILTVCLWLKLGQLCLGRIQVSALTQRLATLPWAMNPWESGIRSTGLTQASS